jgi:lipopolysaccharide biosynthesis regulator YciM
MVKRFLGFVVFASLLLGVGFLFYLNPAVVEFHVTPSRGYTLPLPLLLLGSFLVGAAGIFVLALVRETQWTLAERRWRRRDARMQRIRSLVAAGRELLWHGRAERAKRVLRRAPAEQRGVDSTLMLAETALAADRGEEAKLVLEEGLALQPDDPRLLASLAEIHAREHNWRLATTLLERAVAREPQSPRLTASLRDGYIQERRWEEALRTEERYLAMLQRPQHLVEERRRLLGIRYELALAREAPEESARELYAILRDAPGYLPAAVSLGDLLSRLGRPTEAARVWLRAARKRPLPPLLARLESAYRDLGRPAKMAALYRRLRRRADSPALRRRLIRFLLDEGSLDDAASELAGASVDGVAFALLRAEIERRRGHSELALRELQAATDGMTADAERSTCEECGRSSPRWQPRCPRCGNWDTLVPAEDSGASRTPAVG